jgi:acetyl-CoA carboxylase biotin carboxyl carrier protein
MRHLLDRVDELCAWLAATDIGLLELKGPAGTLRLLHDGSSVIVQDVDGPETTRSHADAVVVRAPSVGIFLDEHPLCERAVAPIGAEIVAGAPLGFLQVGSLLTPVSAPQAGTVIDVLVKHGSVVGYGTPLFELQPIGSNEP